MRNKYFKTLILLFVTCSCILMSCDSDDNNEVEPTLFCQTNQIEFISNRTKEDINFEDNVIVEFEYNEEGNITNIKKSFTREICDNTTCETDADNYETRVIYDGDQITSAVLLTNGEVNEDFKFKFTYVGDELVTLRREYFFDGILSDFDEFRYFYDNGKLEKVEEWETPSSLDELELDRTQVFTYQGENVIRLEGFSATGQSTFIVETNYDLL